MKRLTCRHLLLSFSLLLFACSPDSETIVASLKERAEQSLKESDPLDALDSLEKALELAPERVDLSELYLTTCLQLGLSTTAYIATDDLVEIAPNSLFAREALCKTLLRLEEYSMAWETARSLLETNPDNRVAQYTLAFSCLVDTEETSRSMEIIQGLPASELTAAAITLLQAIQGDNEPTAPTSSFTDELAQSLLGEAFQRWGKLEPAGIAFQKAQEEGSEVAFHTVRKARYLLDTQKPQPALELLAALLEQEPQYLPAMLAQGYAYLALGEASPARERAEEVLAIEDDNPFATFLLIAVLEEEGRQEEALDQLDALVSEFPYAHQPKLKYAEILLHNGQARAALSAIAESRELGGNPAELAYLAARCFLDLGDINSAATETLRLEELRPSDARLNLLRGELSLLRKSYDLALQHFKKALPHPTSQVSAYTGLARLALAQNDFPAAIENYQRAFELDANTKTLAALVDTLLAQQKPNQALELVNGFPFVENQLFQKYLLSGYTHLQLENLQSAQENFNQALELSPHDTKALLGLSKSYQAQGDLPSAIKVLQIDEQNPQRDPELDHQLATLLVEHGDTSSAASVLSSLAQKQPRNIDILLELADLQATELSNPDAAIESLRKARLLEPNNTVVSGTLAKLAFQKGEYDWALALSKEASSRSPGNPSFKTQYALCLAFTGKVDTALSLLNEIETNDAEGLALKRLLSAALNPSHSENLTLLREHLKTNPQNLPCLVALARYEFAQGNTAAAKTHLETALRLYGPHAEALTLLGQLKLSEDAFAEAYELSKRSYKSDASNPETLLLLSSLALNFEDYRWPLALLESRSWSNSDLASEKEKLKIIALLSTDNLDTALQETQKRASNNPVLLEALELLSDPQNTTRAEALTSEWPAEKLLILELPKILLQIQTSREAGDQAGALETINIFLNSYPNCPIALRIEKELSSE